MKTQSICSCFYKGSVYPLCFEDDVRDSMMKDARSMIKLRLEKGESLKEQIKDYKAQLDKIENTLFLHCNPSSAKGLKKVCHVLGMTEDELQTLWYLDISALLILKQIKDDNENGFLIMRKITK